MTMSSKEIERLRRAWDAASTWAAHDEGYLIYAMDEQGEYVRDDQERRIPIEPPDSETWLKSEQEASSG